MQPLTYTTALKGVVSMDISKDRKRGVNENLLDRMGPEHDINSME